ncbi:DUF6122 family protein [Flavobacteriaceae bacterium]|jgi:hypothetical protein|nr:DUF6122 family protein [Flavobacteriaceae bacterium]MDB2336956.1 DUF6122 family protein [Flavobacteriaceae bacterium]MDB2625280.1 DUF6122 family protein [Flavobacteriaceae bacterium]MDB2658684.1 DUF6122 family protein [Flavobacteriaceae bacterium]MDG1980129.1 DUF6122 family protein [Flavobacteriaceae bacterium]
MSFKFLLHYSFHFLVPIAIALLFYKKKWIQVYLIFIGTMLIDLDHLLANPIFDPNRCSINFHPLHTYYAAGAYILMVIPKKSRILGIAFLLHLFTDYLDCYL